MDTENIFSELEKVSEAIPSDVKVILMRSGFDTKTALLCLNEESIIEIEQFVDENRDVLKGTTYENITNEFKFKPGHKIFILRLPDKLKDLEKIGCVNNEPKVFDFSFVLKTFIETAEKNDGKKSKGFRYNDVNRYFSTYIYLLCGRACYETLSANLPIPQASTIRKLT